MDRVEVGRLAGAGDQSGENARGASEGRRSESGLSGIHVPLLRGPARARVAVSQRASVGESPEEGAGEAARKDRFSSELQADPTTEGGSEPAREPQEELL